MKFLANKRLFANLVRSLFEKRRIKTTLAKAKAVQPMVEKRVKKTDRKGGFTRIVKLGKRRGDAAEMVLVEFVDKEEPKKVEPKVEQKAEKTLRTPKSRRSPKKPKLPK